MFGIWLVPISGIYFSSQMLHNVLGLLITIVGCFLFLPTSGWLFDAITSDRVLYFNVNKLWECHLENGQSNKGVNNDK